MRYAWLIPLMAIGLAAIVAVWTVRNRKELLSGRKLKGKPLAGMARAKSLPIYGQLLALYRALFTITIVAFIASIVAGVCLAARPYTTTTENPSINSRDIILCLDVSGSMEKYNEAIVSKFREIAAELDGERIGFTVFDTTAASVFPLTDDYEFISEQLLRAENGLGSSDWNNPDSRWLTEGTSGVGDRWGSSRIGEGVASCVNGFDMLDDQERSRFIVLATDNYSGESAISVPEAAEYARSLGVRIYGLNPDDVSADDGYVSNTAVEYRQATLHTNGAYYKVLRNAELVPDIVDQIMAQDAIMFEGAPKLVERDSPFAAFTVMSVAFAVFIVLIWRLKI